MESLAFIHSAAAYESEGAIPHLRDFNWELAIAATRLPAQSLLLSALVLSAAGTAMAQTAESERDVPFNSAEFIKQTVLTQAQKLQVGTVKTEGKPLNVRDRPSGMVLGTLPDGSRVELTGKAQDGFLQRSNGTWVDEQYIEVQPAAAANPAPASPTPVAVSPRPAAVASPAPSPSPATVASPAPSPSPTVAVSPASLAPRSAAPLSSNVSASPIATSAVAKKGMVKTDGAPLNLRDRPDGATIGTLPNNIGVSLTGKEKDGFVELTNGSWAAKQYIAFDTTAPTTVAATSTPSAARGTNSGVIRTSGTDLNVRRSPNGEIIGALPNGSRVELTGRSVDGWLERTNGTWVFGQFVSYSNTTTPVPNPQLPTGGSTSVGTVRTSGGELNVRRSPGGAVMGALPNGSRVELTGRNVDGWLQRTDGTWVSAQFISTTTAARPTPNPNPIANRPPVGGTVSAGVIRTNGNALNIRQSPGGSVIGSVSNGSRIELSGRRVDGWVQLSNGGWVAENWVAL
jgi:hypothetical protein